MTDNSQTKKTFETKGITTVYCNHAVVSLSFNDCRVYVSEISPSEVAINPVGQSYVQPTPTVDPKLSLVMSPEFARNFAKSILDAINTYQSVFGSLRPDPTQAEINKALGKLSEISKPI